MSLNKIDESVLDANGERWVYRRTSSVLERRKWGSSVWFRVTPQNFETITPAELRHVAMILEAQP